MATRRRPRPGLAALCLLISLAGATAAPSALAQGNAAPDGPRGLDRVPDGNGGVKRVPNPDPVDPPDNGVTQPEPGTPLDMSKLEHIEVQGVTPTPDGAKLDLGKYTGYIRVLSPDLVNVAVVDAGKPAPESPAILKHDYPAVTMDQHDEGGQYRIKTSGITVEISKKPFAVRMRDSSGRVINEDDPRYGSGYESGKPYVFKKADKDEDFYGFGEQTRSLNKRGDSIGMWNTDAYSYHKDTKYLYTSIPFFVGLRNGNAYGLLFDNTYRSNFEMASNGNDGYHFYANGGPLSYYVFNGPKISDVIQRYTELTGRFKEPPTWALGWQQSKWGYTRDDFLNVARTYREKGIPLDALHLDIDYMDAYRVFTWGECCADVGNVDRTRGGVIGDPYAFHRELDNLHVNTVSINDPAVKQDPGYSMYEEGNANDYWAKNPDGSDFVGEVWPKASKFPDFTRQDVRDWWASKHNVLFDPGVDGLWLDMNEPAVFDGPHHTMPLDVQFDHGKMDHRQVHNIYGFRETEATAEAFDKYKPGQRPFVLTRDMFAGSQRWAALWTGDNASTWDHLKMSIPMNLNIGLSGVPMVGNDIGGFASRPTPELMARWLEVGALLPFARDHYDSDAKSTVKQGQEPWAFGPEVEDIGRRYIRLRYALLPYLQNAFRRAADTGEPIWQPLFYQFQDDPDTHNIDDEFMLGDRLLAAPVVEQGQTTRRVYLPKGTTWTDYWTGETVQGGRWIERSADLGTLPLYVRADSIIPSRDVQQYTGERPLTDLTLDAWVDQDAETTFYEDDGKSLDYEKGAYDATKFTVARKGNGYTFTTQDVHDGYDSQIKSYTLRIHDVDRPSAVTQAGSDTPLTFRYDESQKVLEADVPAGAGPESVDVRF
jgi:alpha-glucosidase